MLPRQSSFEFEPSADKPYGRFSSKTSASTLPSLPALSSSDANNDSDCEENLDVETAKPDFVPSDSYYEFNLSLPKQSKVKNTEISNGLSKDQSKTTSVSDKESITSNNNLNKLEKQNGFSKPLTVGTDWGSPKQEATFKHPIKMDSPQDLEKHDDEDADDFFNSKKDWQAMQTISEMDYYDDKGELAYSSRGIFDQSRAGSRGYTKIDTEAQVVKFEAMNKKTDFLFEVSKKVFDSSTELNDNDDVVDDDDDDDDLDSSEKLESTKNMLEESQKIAYAAIIRLIECEMATKLALLKTFTSSKIAKTLSESQKSMGNWTQVITTKLNDHLDMKPEEREMIEKISGHGLEISDLSGSLLNTSRGEKLVWILICDMFLLLLEDGYYDARSRTLLLSFAQYLNVSSIEVYQFERRLIDSLEMNADQALGNPDEKLSDRTFIERRIKKNQKKRLAYIGLATLGGGLAIGLSAGLLAPVIGAGIAAGLTTVGITGTTGFLAGIGGGAIITTTGVLTGVRVGSKAGARRLGEVKTFEIKPLHDNKRANLVLTVSGWMNGELDDVRLPFSTVDPVMGDLFSLLWEPEMLRSMGQTIGILASEALSTSIQQILGATILTTLMSAIQLPMALSKLSYLLDNPWNVSLDRAWKAGKILADTILSGNLGVRPITLVGFSLGARLIYSCLIELSQRKGYGLVQDVIILGSPITVDADQFALARSVVSGRFINGYSRKDWILGYLFRATGGGLKRVAGLTNIEGVENLDCSDFVDGHMSYRKAIPKILKSLEWEILSEEFAEIEEPDPEQAEKARKLVDEFDELRAKMEKGEDKRKGWKKWFKPKSKEWWDNVGGDGTEVKNNEGVHEVEKKNGETNDNQEYIVEPQPIFDVNALMQEVNDIENMAKYGKRPVQANDPKQNPSKDNEDLSNKQDS